MITFVLLAALLTIAGIALIAIPLLKKQPAEYSPAPWAALVATGVLALGSTLFYLQFTNWSWQAKSADDSPQTMVARLARNLEKHPDDAKGWLMLGRSYTVLQQYQLATRAFRRANRLAGGKSAEALVGEAEALVLNDETEIDRNGGRLFEQALALDPSNGKALFFAAAAALRRGDQPLAKERFIKLLALNPPENIKALLEKQIEVIDQQTLAGGVAPGGGTASQQAGVGGSSARPGVGGRPGAPSGGPAATAPDPAAKVRINVMLAPGLAQSAAAGSSPLFVFVRDPQRPGPPLAVKRLDSHFPQTVELTALDSMMPGRAITTGQKVEVVARIARSGNPVGASGDPFGESAYQVGRDGLINIVIDRLTP
jgi:cytochrome c-type biogenesis protein CcmH